MINRLIFDREFQERLNTVNEAAYRYFKIKTEYDETIEKLHLLLDEQKEKDGELVQLLK